jgi:hypothetical protein
MSTVFVRWPKAAIFNDSLCIPFQRRQHHGSVCLPYRLAAALTNVLLQVGYVVRLRDRIQLRVRSLAWSMVMIDNDRCREFGSEMSYRRLGIV